MSDNVIMMLDEMPTLPKVVQRTNDSARELLVLLAFIGHKNNESVLNAPRKYKESEVTMNETS